MHATRTLCLRSSETLLADCIARPARRYGWTALMVAVVNGNAPVVELLLKRGANPNLADEYNPAQPPRSISGGSPGSSRVNFMRMLQVE